MLHDELSLIEIISPKSFEENLEHKMLVVVVAARELMHNLEFWENINVVRDFIHQYFNIQFNNNMCSIVTPHNYYATKISQELEKSGVYDSVELSKKEILTIEKEREPGSLRDPEFWEMKKKFSYLEKSIRILHGAYKQTVPSKKGKISKGEIRRFLEKNPDYFGPFCEYLGETLYEKGYEDHARNLFFHAKINIPSKWNRKNERVDFFEMLAREGKEDEEAKKAILVEYIEECWDNSPQKIKNYIVKIWGEEHSEVSIYNPIIDAMMKYKGNFWWESDDMLKLATYQVFEPIMLVDPSKYHTAVRNIYKDNRPFETALAMTQDLQKEILEIMKEYLIKKLYPYSPLELE